MTLFFKAVQIKTEPCEVMHRGDGEADIAVMGFIRGFPCVELITLMPILIERSIGIGDILIVVQIECARAYDTVRHGAVFASMRRRSFFGDITAAYLRERAMWH